MYMHANLMCKSVLLASTCCNYFHFIFPFLRAAVRAVSLVRPVPLFFCLCCAVWFVMEQIKIARSSYGMLLRIVVNRN